MILKNTHKVEDTCKLLVFNGFDGWFGDFSLDGGFSLVSRLFGGILKLGGGCCFFSSSTGPPAGKDGAPACGYGYP